MAQRIDGVDPFQNINLEIARGRVSDATAIDKFGLNASVGSSFEPITDLGVQNYLSSAQTVTIASQAGTPADDNGVEVVISGLDENYVEQSVTLTLAGSGTATSTETFLRVFRAYVSNGQAPTDDLLIEAADGTDLAQITYPYNQTNMAVYTIPAGKTGYLTSGNLSSLKDKDITAKLLFRPEGGVFNTKGVLLTPGTPYQRTWSVPPAVAEKTDIEIQAKAGATGAVAAGFELILVDN